MKIRITKGENAKVIISRDLLREDTEMDELIACHVPEEKHPEDITKIILKWETETIVRK